MSNQVLFGHQIKYLYSKNEYNAIISGKVRQKMILVLIKLNTFLRNHLCCFKIYITFSHKPHT